MPKAREVYRALLRDGWVLVRRPGGSHRRLRKGDQEETWAHHDGRDLGKAHMAQIAATFGYTPQELREKL